MRLKRIEEKYPLDATEVRAKVNGKFAIFRIKDLTAAFKDLTDDMPTGQGADVEDLTPLAEMLKDE